MTRPGVELRSPRLLVNILTIMPIARKVKLATVIEGDHKALFSKATTSSSRGECLSFPWIAPLYPRYIPYIAEC